MEPNHYFVTDDKYLSELLPNTNIISTETFVKICSNENVKKAYTDFLFECNFVGVDLTEDFIISEYHKMRNSNNGRMVAILQSLKENPYLLFEATIAALYLAQMEQDIAFLEATLTNMYVMLFKGLEPSNRDNIIDNLEEALTSSANNTPIIMKCIHNARLIVIG